jgi:RNase H-like domain found in reverse transcriptase/Integrase core domain/Integrase zinc binding domain/Reverse transcriptase (RNA-dependent DNA polymerase)
MEALVLQISKLVLELQAQRNPPEVSRDQITKNLAEQMTTFSYDPEAGLTFEAWYDRYESIFRTEIAAWDSPSKIRLLMIKFSQQDYQRFADSVLPQKPTELTLDDTIKLLKNMFGHRETRFALRHKCFNLRKDDSESFTDFAARINKHGEKFDVTHCTADDLKVLLFVSGLKSAQDSLILEKLLSKVDTQCVALEAAPDDAARARIHKLTLKDLVNEAQRLISLKLDKSTVGSPANIPQEVFAIHQNQRKFKPSNDRNSGTSGGTRPSSPQSSKLPKRACGFCNEMHWQRDCPYKEKTCTICSSVGHKNGFCASAIKELTRVYSRNERRGRNSDPTQYIRTTTNQVASSTMSSKSLRKFIAPSINGARIRLQLDSASDITIISSDNWKKLGKPSLTPIKISPGSASGDQIQLWGSFLSNINFNGKTATGTCYVSARLNLLGIDWISALGLWNVPFATICNVITSQTNRSDLTTEAQSRFPILFSGGLGLCTKTKASLTLKPNAQPTYRKARPVSLAAKTAIEDEVKRQQHLGVFTQVSFSDFAAPIVTVKKKNGKTRICGDYSTGLNDSLEPNKFPLPTPEEIFDELHGKKIYSKIDLADAFLQVELDDDAKKLLTVNTHLGLQQINRLQPGVKTAPGFFQELMTKMLSGIDGAFAFIDDIVLGADDEVSHKKLLFNVLDRIQEYGFKLRIEKCEFGKQEILYCGHIIDAKGVRPDPEKIQQILDMPRPNDVSQLRSFLGAANYYGKFVTSIGKLRGPLDELTLKDVKFDWQPKQQEAFEKLKQVLASDLILTHFDPNKKIIVAADASAYGKGGSIMHEFPDGSLHPIKYVSKSFKAAEKNYSQIQREAVALVFTVKRFRKYLYGRRFTLQTDHKPLLSIFGSKTGIPAYTASRLQRYALFLLDYDFDIRYIGTDAFGYADVVSRLIAEHPKEHEDTVIAAIQLNGEEVNCFAIETASTLPIKFSDIKSATENCATLKNVIKYVNNGWPDKMNQIHSKDVANYFPVRNELITIDGCLFHGDRIIIPNRFRQEILSELHNGHPGSARMKLLAHCKVFWPGISNDIDRYVKTCEQCAIASKTPIKCELKSWPTPTAPWSRIHIDFAGPINGFSYLVIVDAYSNWPEIFKTTSTTTARTTQMLDEAFARHGLPDTLVSDNGPQFISTEFKSFCNKNGIEHIRTAPYHPQSNGRAEKFVDLLKTGLNKATGNSDEKLRQFLTTYRFTPSYVLGNKSPSELINNRIMKTRLDLLKPPQPVSHIRNENMERRFNVRHGALWKEFEVGDPIFYMLHHGNDSWEWTQGTISERFGRVNYSLQLDNGRTIAKAHANQLKARYSNELIDAFGLTDVSDTEIEPTITPQNINPNDGNDQHREEQEESDESDAYEDAEEVPEPVAALRRTTRFNAGVPAQRYSSS